MKTPVSRRVALAAGVSVAAGLLGGPVSTAPVPKAVENKSWVGRTVMPKKPLPTGAYPPRNGSSEDLRSLRSASWEVKAEKGSRVLVLENGIACWVEQDALVPLGNAVAFYTRALKIDETDAYKYNSRGWAQYLLGEPEEAVKDFNEFLKRPPADGSFAAEEKRAVGLGNRGLVLAEMGMLDAALKDLNASARLGYISSGLYRGWAYELQGEYKKAVGDYTSSLEHLPAAAHNKLARLRATCPNAAFRDGKAAVTLANRACDLSGDREGMYLDTLAAAHAEAGDFAAAVKSQELALEDRSFTIRHGEDAQKRLQLYKDKKPFRSAPLKP